MVIGGSLECREGETMKCHRCYGMMVWEECQDFLETDSSIRIWAWCCIACGDICDPLILEHRMAQLASHTIPEEVSS